MSSLRKGGGGGGEKGEEEDGLVVGIDNQAVFLNDKFDTYEKYMEKVRGLVGFLASTPTEEFAGMTKVR